jgi:hypothetical protein
MVESIYDALGTFIDAGQIPNVVTAYNVFEKLEVAMERVEEFIASTQSDKIVNALHINMEQIIGTLKDVLPEFFVKKRWVQTRECCMRLTSVLDTINTFV